jgi:hypothetical protein
LVELLSPTIWPLVFFGQMIGIGRATHNSGSRYLACGNAQGFGKKNVPGIPANRSKCQQICQQTAVKKPARVIAQFA